MTRLHHQPRHLAMASKPLVLPARLPDHIPSSETCLETSDLRKPLSSDLNPDVLSDLNPDVSSDLNPDVSSDLSKSTRPKGHAQSDMSLS